MVDLPTIFSLKVVQKRHREGERETEKNQHKTNSFVSRIEGCKPNQKKNVHFNDFPVVADLLCFNNFFMN